MVKILSQAGNSLADTYDVKGSVAGIDELNTSELPIVHEMGATIFSERFSTTVRRVVSGNVAQNTDIDLTLDNLPDTPARLLGIAVLSDDPSRIAHFAILARDPRGGREFPVWVYNVGQSESIRIVEEGAPPAQTAILFGEPEVTFIPNFMGGNDQPQIVNELAARGRTTAFGAGTVFARVLIYIAFGQIGAISSRGLPIPSW